MLISYLLKEFLFVILCLAVCRFHACKGQRSDQASADLFAKNTIPQHHLRGARWELELTSPIRIYFAIDILDISQIRVSNGDFRLDMNMKQRWTENSLEVPPGLFLPEEPNDTKITTDGAVLDDLWIPDLYIPNARESSIESLTFDQKSVTIFKNKTIIYSANINTVIGCPMEFHWYPLETQRCRLVLESYSFAVDKVTFEWDTVTHPQPVLLPLNMKLRQYTLKVPLPAWAEIHNGRFGVNVSYSRLYVSFEFQRQIGHYLIQAFAPTFLIVALSWFSFWLGLDAIPGRVALLVTCMLTLVTFYAAQSGDLPPVAYIKMMDIWMAACLGFVFAAMFEFIVARYMFYKDKTLKEEKDSDQGKTKKSRNDLADNEYSSSYLEFYQKRDQAFKSQLLNDEMKLLGSRLQHGPMQAWDLAPYDDFYLPSYSTKKELLNVIRRQNQSRPTFFRNPTLRKECFGQHYTKLWEKLDKISRIAFPLLFACFSAVYWPVLVFGPSDETSI